MSKERSEYLAIKDQYDEAKQDVLSMIATVQIIVDAIRLNPTREDKKTGKMALSVKLPPTPEKIPSAFSVLGKNEWPDVKQIRSKLGILNDLFLKTKELWSLIPDSEKKNMVPPDKELRL